MDVVAHERLFKADECCFMIKCMSLKCRKGLESLLVIGTSKGLEATN